MKGLILEYQLNRKPNADVLKACDEGRAGMQALLIEAARVVVPISVPLVWLLTRFYKREVADNSIRFTFPLIRGTL